MSVLRALLILVVASISPAAAQNTSWRALPHFRQLRFSADGQYILAQDNSTITVLSAKPLKALFWIAANNTPLGRFSLAHFTPDSREVVFILSTVRENPKEFVSASTSQQVERWSIADHERIAFRRSRRRVRRRWSGLVAKRAISRLC
jgi:dipeptidyl aminopeptidase/acylaminoacyl peptidase